MERRSKRIIGFTAARQSTRVQSGREGMTAAIQSCVGVLRLEIVLRRSRKPLSSRMKTSLAASSGLGIACSRRFYVLVSLAGLAALALLLLGSSASLAQLLDPECGGIGISRSAHRIEVPHIGSKRSIGSKQLTRAVSAACAPLSPA